MAWVKAHTDQLPAAPLPDELPLHIVEMDELYTFIGTKKARLPRHPSRVSHELRGRLGVCTERDERTLQCLLDASPQAVWYYSDLFAGHAHADAE